MANIQSATQGNGNCPDPTVFFEEALGVIGQGAGSDSTHAPTKIFAPSITNCQVLVILALQQHGVAEYSRAAMLIGLASAMAIELKLHRVYETNNLVEREIRSRLWWNLYILEKMMSVEMGRPVLLRFEEADNPWPSVSEADEFEFMPQQLPASTTAIKMRTMSGLHTTISLSMIMERIHRQVYGIAARKGIREDQSAGEQLRMQLWLELQDWEKDVNASPLRLDLSDELTSVPPSIVNTGMHVPFLCCLRDCVQSIARSPKSYTPRLQY